MPFPFFVARRYFLSKYNANAINIISVISMIAVVVVTAAMIIVFSALNGFEGLVKELYNSFYPEIVIQPAKGKVFSYEGKLREDLENIEGITFICQTLEEKALIKNGDRQAIVLLKGVDSNFTEVAEIHENIVRGEYLLTDQYHNNYIVLGAGVEYRLGVNVSDQLAQLQVYMPRRGKISSFLPQHAFVPRQLFPSGSFSIQNDFDGKYGIIPLHLCRELLRYKGNEVSQLELKLTKDADVDDVKEAIVAKIGNDYVVKDQLEQNATLYQVMQLESWVVYFILSLILLIAIFNIGGFLVMLLLDKKKDIFILKSMGANDQMIRSIFLYEGVFISMLGCFLGIAISVTMVVIQQQFGIIKIPGDSFVVSTYPLLLKWQDLWVVFVTVLTISLIASYLPTRTMKNII